MDVTWFGCSVYTSQSFSISPPCLVLLSLFSPNHCTFSFKLVCNLEPERSKIQLSQVPLSPEFCLAFWPLSTLEPQMFQLTLITFPATACSYFQHKKTSLHTLPNGHRSHRELTTNYSDHSAFSSHTHRVLKTWWKQQQSECGHLISIGQKTRNMILIQLAHASCLLEVEQVFATEIVLCLCLQLVLRPTSSQNNLL